MAPEEIEELYERRMAEKVAASVEQTIKHRYAWIGVVAIVASWVGGGALVQSIIQFSVDSGVTREIGSRTDAFNKMADDIVKADMSAQAELNNLRKTLKDVEEQAQNIEKQQEALEIKRESLEGKIADLDRERVAIEQNVQQSNLTISQNSLRFQQEIADLTKAANGLASLANQFQTLQGDVAALSKGQKIEVSSSSISDVGGIADSVRQSTRTLAQPTVYLEFAGPQARDLARQIAEKLKDSNVKIPGFELVEAKVNEVRFYYEEDRQLATRVARDATAIKAGLGVVGDSVRPIDYTKWPRAKPPKNTVELWIDLSQAP